ncbi:MAG: Flp pilus assembly protein CpaB [Gemmatimonadales bacterium]|nr:Flp pilus assembly protein CpaB [Gemmatimonadales bacterium]
MDKKGIALLLVAVVLAVAAGGSVYLYLKGMPTAATAGEQVMETVPVVVASKDLTFGTLLKEHELSVVNFPKESVPSGSYSSLDSVLNQTTKVFVVAGEPILASKLSSIGGGLSVRIPSHMRAMSVKIDEVTGVSGFVLPGDRVDVVVTVENVAGTNVAVTKTILQDIEVLAAGTKTETHNNRNITVQTATLVIDPDGAEKLALGVHQGKVHLSLRNPVDHQLTEARSTDTRDMLGMNKPTRSSTRRSTPTTTVTHKDPVKVENPSFTVIRDGRILKQESVVDEQDPNKK